MKITIKYRKNIQAGAGLKVDHASGNSMVTAGPINSKLDTYEARIAAIEADLGAVESTLAGYTVRSFEICDSGTPATVSFVTV